MWAIGKSDLATSHRSNIGWERSDKQMGHKFVDMTYFPKVAFKSFIELLKVCSHTILLKPGVGDQMVEHSERGK